MKRLPRKTFAATFRPNAVPINLDNGDFECIQHSLWLHGFKSFAIGAWTAAYLSTSPEVLRANLDERHN